jgi:predicted transglutaminase-like cysteine proteinase|tara:strand:+ start:5434 stop:5949 length:516 start_codon:yes stop_codon:yes gene_type:complete
MDDSEIRALAKEVHATVYDLSTYVHDQDNFGTLDDWRDHWDEVKNNQQFKDDCDGEAWTNFVGCCEVGIPLEAVNVTTVAVEPFTDQWGKKYETIAERYHMVCTVDLSDRTLVLDNRYDKVWEVGDLPYTWSLPEDDVQYKWFFSFNAKTQEWTTTKQTSVNETGDGNEDL